MNTKRKIKFRERFKIMFGWNQYVVEVNNVLLISNEVKVENYLIALDKCNAEIDYLKIALDDNKVKNTLLENEILELKADRVKLIATSKKLCDNADINIKVFTDKNRLLRQTNFKLTNEIDKHKNSIERLTAKYEERLFKKREVNRRLEEEIQEVYNLDTCEVFEEFKKITKHVPARKIKPFLKLLAGLKCKIEDLSLKIVELKM